MLRRLGGHRLLLLSLHSLLTRSCLPTNYAKSTLHFASKGSRRARPLTALLCWMLGAISLRGLKLWLPCPLSNGNAAFYLDKRREMAAKGSTLCAAAGLGPRRAPPALV